MWGSDFDSSEHYYADTVLLQPYRFLLYSVAGFLNDRIATADAEGMPSSLLPSYDIAIVYRV